MPASPGCSSSRKRQQLVARAALGDDPVEEVRPVVAGGEDRRARRGSWSTMSRRVGSSAVAVSASSGTSGKRSLRIAERLVFAAEIVAPLRDAMRLVDGEEREPAIAAAARGSAASSAARARRRAGRAPPSRDRALDRAGLGRREARVERRGAAPRPGAARRPGPSSARSAARRRRRGPGAAAPAAGSTATCRRRSASARSRRRRPRHAR